MSVETQVYEVKVLLRVMVPMRDGVKLATDVYLPDADGPFPAIMQRTPYGNGTRALSTGGMYHARQGFVVVVQDCRGTGNSEGELHPWYQEVADGEDCLSWIAAQPWCNGDIGTDGVSYSGGVQWLAAQSGHPNLRAIMPHVAPTDMHATAHFIGGALSMCNSACWGLGLANPAQYPHPPFNWDVLLYHLPLRTLDEAAGMTLPYWKQWIAHPDYDEYWQAMDTNQRYAQIKAPALVTGGWFDIFAPQIVEGFAGMRAHGGSPEARAFSRCIIGAWDHCQETGDVDYGPDAFLNLDPAREQFLHGLLTDPTRDPLPEWAPLHYFVMGRNVWRDAESWPLPETRYTDYFLHSGGLANTRFGDGVLSTEAPVAEEPTDVFLYNPRNPVPTVGGNHLPSKYMQPGSREQSAVEEREDVLVYSTPVLEEDVEAVGPIKVVLYATTSGFDTDFTAKLVDVHPDGRAYNLCDGIIRARYRNSFAKAELVEPGTVYEYTIDCWPTANAFLKGHRIRVEISSSNFPRFDRNPNTGHAFGEDDEVRIAKQQILHTPEYPSRLVLPVIP